MCFFCIFISPAKTTILSSKQMTVDVSLICDLNGFDTPAGSCAFPFSSVHQLFRDNPSRFVVRYKTRRVLCKGRDDVFIKQCRHKFKLYFCRKFNLDVNSCTATSQWEGSNCTILFLMNITQLVYWNTVCSKCAKLRDA